MQNKQIGISVMIHYDQYRLKEEKIRPDRNLRPVVLLCVVYCIELSETKTNWNKLLYHSTSIVFIETTTNSSDD